VLQGAGLEQRFFRLLARGVAGAFEEAAQRFRRAFS